MTTNFKTFHCKETSNNRFMDKGTAFIQTTKNIWSKNLLAENFL